MSLQVSKNSRGEKVWRCQWRENGKGRTRVLGKVTEMSRSEADKLRRAIIDPIAKRSSSGAGVTLAKFVRDEYLTAKSVSWKRSTELTTTDLIERHILKPLGERVMPSVTRKDLQGLLNALAVTHSESVVLHVRWQLLAIFGLALSDGRVIVTPAAALETPRAARKKKSPTVGDQSQINRALMTMPPMERLFTALCNLRGMRCGEVAALKISDVRGDVLTVERRVYRGVVDTVKNNQPRTVPIGELLPLVKEHCSTLLDQSLDAWLFPNERGDKPRNANALYRKRIKPLLKAAGIDDLNFQAMRKTFGNALRQVEPDAKTRAAVMGHSRSVHENEYIVVTDDEKRTSINKMGNNLQ